jgi:phosphoserine aminotransferase
MMQPVAYEAAPDTSSQRLWNFSAGPGTLPLTVLEEVRAELPVYPGVGASIVEISHRSPAYTEVNESAGARMKALLGLGDDWQVLFLQGGA